MLRDFRQWPRWSPWLIAEPDCPLTYADNGLSYAWDGKIIGAGRMEIVGEDASHSIDFRLTFLKPWKSVSQVAFRLTAKNGGTEVTWTMDGSLPLFLFFLKGMMEGFVGMDYERGLQMLKDCVESGAARSRLDFVGEEDFRGFEYVGVRTRCAIGELSSCMRRDMAKLTQAVKQPVGRPFAIYHKWSPAKGAVEYTLGFPVAPGATAEGLLAGKLPGCRVYLISHTGPYRGLGNAWSAGMMRARAKVFRQDRSLASFETYENDPTEVPEDDLVTTVRFPVKA